MLSRCRVVLCVLLSALSLPCSAATLTLVSTATTSFPSTAVAATSASQTVQITLSGALVLKSIAVPQSINSKQEFTVGKITGCAVDGATSNVANTTCSVAITFTPAYPGYRHQPLVVTDSTGQVYSFGLSGTATGSLSIRYPGIGAVTVGASGGIYYSGDGGPAANARLGEPYQVFVDNSGNEYYVDYSTANVRVIFQGGDHLACLIEMTQPAMFGLSAAATSCAGATSTPVAGDIYTLAGDQTLYSATVTTHATGATGDGGLARDAKIAQPVSIAVDAAGNLFFGDATNYTIRVIYSGGPQVACLIQVENPASFGLAAGATSCTGATSQPAFGSIWTLIGLSGTASVGPSGDNGLATSARIVYPYAMALSPDGDIYLTDNSVTTTKNARIRVIYAGGANTAKLITLENPTVPTPTYGFVYRLAGSTSVATDAGDGGLASSAGILYARGLALDPNGNLFFSGYDAYTTKSSNPANKVRAVYLQGTAVANLISTLNSGVAPQPGFLYDIAGVNGAVTTFSGDGGPATSAQLLAPYGVALDPGGNIYVTDYSDYIIRKIGLADGIITTVFGTAGSRSSGTSTSYSPYGLQFTSDGGIVFTDTLDYRLRQVSPGANGFTFATAASPQSVATVSAPQSVVEANIGNASLGLLATTVSTNFALDVPAFAGVRACNTTSDSLAIGAQCAFAVNFSPVVAGTLTGNLNINDTSLNTTTTLHQVALTGYSTGLAVPSISLATSSLSISTGATETLTATVSSPGGTPTGLVTFLSGTTTLNTVSLLNGVAMLPTTALPVGTDKVTAQYSGDQTFSPVTSTAATIVVATPAFTLGSTLTGITVVRGQSTTVPLTITTVGGYAQAVTGSCTGLPVGVFCTFTPQSVQTTGANTTFPWSVAISASNGSGTSSITAGSSSLGSGVLFGFTAALFGFAGLRRRRRMTSARLLSLLLVALAGVTIAALSGCSTISPVAPRETVNITITATDSTSAQSIPLTVTVEGTSSN